MSKIIAKKNLDSELFRNKKHRFKKNNKKSYNYYHLLFYGMQTCFGNNNYFFDIILSYQTQTYLYENFYTGAGIFFMLPCYLFSKYLFDFNNIYSYKKTFFIGPLLIPLLYENENYKIAWKIILLFSLPVLFGNMVFDKDENVDINIIPYISHYSYLVEYGFIHIITGIEFSKYIFSFFTGLRFVTHLEDLDLVHLLKHIYSCFCKSFFKNMFLRCSPCYYKDSIVLRKCLKYNNGNYDYEIIKQKLLMHNSSFCSLDFILNISIAL